MRLVPWKFQDLKIMMIEDSQRNLRTTSSVLCLALGVTPNALIQIWRRHKEEFDSGCVTLSHVPDTEVDLSTFLRTHKDALGIKQLKGNMHLWSENDMILFAVYSQTRKGMAFRRGLLELIKQNATRGYATREELNEMQAQIEELRSLLADAQPALQTTASAAGVALSAQRGTKLLRTLH